MEKNNWEKNTALYLASQTISIFGSSLVQYAIMWHITLETQSGIMMTISIICGFLPTLFLSPFAGVWADRFDRKKLIIISDLTIAAVTLVLAIFFMVGYKMIWLLFLASALRSLGSSVQEPAVNAFLPQFVPENQLMKVNSFKGSLQSLTALASPLLSGFLLSFFSIEYIFLIDVITAIIAVLIMVLFLNVPSHAGETENSQIDYLEDLKCGFRYIKTEAFLKHYFIIAAFFMIFASPAMFLTPLQIARNFGNEVWRLTAFEMIFSVGMLLGGLLMAVWGGFKNKTRTMALSSFIMGLLTVVMGIIPWFWPYIITTGLIGTVMVFFNTSATVILQEKVEEKYLGRVFAVMSMISSSLMPLGMLIYGPLVDRFSIEPILIVTGLLVFSQGFMMLGSKPLMEAGK